MGEILNDIILHRDALGVEKVHAYRSNQWRLRRRQPRNWLRCSHKGVYLERAIFGALNVDYVTPLKRHSRILQDHASPSLQNDASAPSTRYRVTRAIYDNVVFFNSKWTIEIPIEHVHVAAALYTACALNRSICPDCNPGQTFST